MEYNQTFTKGQDGPVPVANGNLTIVSPNPLQHAQVVLASSPDGASERLLVEPAFSHPAISIHYLATTEDFPAIIYLIGPASAEVFAEALKSVRYVNDRGRPTEGERVVMVTIYDGYTVNSVWASHTVLSVSIANAAPVLSVSGDSQPFTARFFPLEGPVPAVSPTQAYVVDEDSHALQEAVLQIMDAKDGEEEELLVTYESPEAVSLPVVAESLDLNIPFGTLSGREPVPHINDTLQVNASSASGSAVVGDVGVVLDIRHSWVGDLRVELEHEGFREVLVQGPGGQACSRDDLRHTAFDSSSTVVLQKSTHSPGLCQFQTQGLFSPEGDLSRFAGTSMGGEWLLHVTDLLLARDNGRLVSWSLVLQPQEPHLLVSPSALAPPISVGGGKGYSERHSKLVQSDGRIADISVQVHLAYPHTSHALFLPSLSLLHPDGSRVWLANGTDLLCATGNYTYLVFDDKAGETLDYTCASLLAVNSSQPLAQDLDIFSLNVTLPAKHSQADVLPPATPLSSLRGKTLAGEWTLVLSSENEASLTGWSMRVAREPNIDARYNHSSSTLTLSGADSPQNYQAVLRSVVYNNTSPSPDFLVPRRVEVSVSDGELRSNTSLPSSLTLLVVHHIEIDLDPLDLTPAVAPGYHVDFIEHSGPVPIADPLNAILQDAAFGARDYVMTLTLEGYQNLGAEGISLNSSSTPELLVEQVTNDSTRQFSLIVSVNASSGEQPIAAFQQVLRTAEYFNAAEELVGANRSVEVLVTDMTAGSDFTSTIAMATIGLVHVNDRPILVLNSAVDQTDGVSNMVEYSEGEGSVLLANASGLVLIDHDHTHLLGAVVEVLNPLDGESDVLEANASSTAISVSYNSTTNTLLLAGRDTIENYTSVLATVAYSNLVHSPGRPSTTARQVSFVVQDDAATESLPAIAVVSFSAVNDAPFGDLNGMANGTVYSTVFREEEGAVLLVSPEAVLYDVDNATLEYVTVRITDPQDGGQEQLDVSDVTSNYSTADSFITSTLIADTVYDPMTFTLLISGLLSVTDYQEVLRTLTYNNLADEPTGSERVVEIIASDGDKTSDPFYTNVTIIHINDSPYFPASRPPFLPQMPEDHPEDVNRGFMLSDLAYLIGDDDADSMKGIALTYVDPSNGMWEYSIDGGSMWEQVADNLSHSNALLLQAQPDILLRFFPDMDFNGLADFSFVAWDGTDGTLSGEYSSALSLSPTDPFSAEAMTVSLEVTPVNDAPELLDEPVVLTSIQEDDYSSLGDTVYSLLQRASDVDVLTFPLQHSGVAIVQAEHGNGTWEFSVDGGQTWSEVMEVNRTSALLLHAQPIEMQRIRFVPDLDFNGESTIEFLAWDLTGFGSDGIVEVTSGSGSGSGFMGSGSTSSESGFGYDSMNNTEPRYESVGGFDDITGPFSLNSSMAVVVVEPVNDSPVISAGMMLHSIYEDTPPDMNHGTSVRHIVEGNYSDVEGHYSDVDASHAIGLAVVGVDDANGYWQYRCNTSDQWSDFIGDVLYNVTVPALPEPSKATLLLSSCFVRFVPRPHFNTELDTDGYPWPHSVAPCVTVRGWDNTGDTHGRSGTYGNNAMRAEDSATNEFSEEVEKVCISVLSVNDVPELALDGPASSNYETVFVEDGLSVAVVGPGLTLVDHDNDRLRDITITIHGSFLFDLGNISDIYSTLFSAMLNTTNGTMLNNTDTANGTMLNSTDTANGTMLNSTDTANGTMLNSTDTANGTMLNSTDTANNTMFNTSDAMSGSSSYIPVVSSAPYYPPLDVLAQYVMGLPNASYLERYCAGLEPRHEEVMVDTSGTDLKSEVLSWCPFVLRIFADDTYIPDAPVEQFEYVLRSTVYNNSIQEPENGTRTVSFLVSDNIGLSNVVNTSVEVRLVNDAPVLDLNAELHDFNNYVSFVEREGPILLANSSIKLTDTDDMYLEGARVVLANAPDADQEVLNASVSGTSITADYTNYTLFLSGTASVQTYAHVLASVTYVNRYANPGNPDQRERQVYFFVSDGKNESLPAIAFISFTGVNDRPQMDVNGDSMGPDYRTDFTEEGGPVSIVDPNMFIHDEDNSSIAYVTVQITNLLDGDLEYLEVDNVTLSSPDGEGKVFQVVQLFPEATYNSSTGELLVSGLDSVDEYTAVLRTVRYNNLADEPSADDRVVRFTANDGELDSTPVNTTITMLPVNDPPRFNSSASIVQPLILEDDTEWSGLSVEEIAYPLIEDDDVGDPRGMAVVAVDNTNGYWQYMTNGSQWRNFKTNTSVYSAILLRAVPDNVIRFVPKHNFNGDTSLTFVAWDVFYPLPDGMPKVVVDSGADSPFSIETRTLELVVVPVNDAPVTNTSIQPQMTTILEDSVWERESLGDDVSLFLAALQEDVDQDMSMHEFGIAIVMVDLSNGRWEVSTDAGLNWTDAGEPTPEAAVVLRSRPTGDNRVHFFPNRDFHGTTFLTYKLWDLNMTWPSGTAGVDTSSTDPVTGTFSEDATQAHLTVEPVNDSPVLEGDVQLTPSIEEDVLSSSNTGSVVEGVFADVYFDVDTASESQPFVGVAVVGVDNTNGVWEYMCDEEWMQFIGDNLFGQAAPMLPIEPRATVLDKDCRVRFSPDANFNTEFDLQGNPRAGSDQPGSDQPCILVKAWDNTGQFQKGDYGVDTTSQPDDHTDPFSREVHRACLNVTSVADSPVLSLDSPSKDYLTVFTEPLPPKREAMAVPIVNRDALQLTDVDNANLTLLRVELQPRYDQEEHILLNTSGTELNYTIVEGMDSSYILVVEPASESSAPIEQFLSVLLSLEYTNTAEEPSPPDREISMLVFDGAAVNFPRAYATVAIQLVNDPPELDLNGEMKMGSFSFLSYEEGQGALLLGDPGLRLVDHDSAVLANATVEILLAPDQDKEVLSAQLNTSSNITSEFDGTRLVLAGPASRQEFEDALRTVTYDNTFAHPGNPSVANRTIRFVVSDGEDYSIPAYVYLSFTGVNNAPMLDTNGLNVSGLSFNTTFYEQMGPVAIVSPDTVLVDIDSANLEFIEVN